MMRLKSPAARLTDKCASRGRAPRRGLNRQTPTSPPGASRPVKRFFRYSRAAHDLFMQYSRNARLQPTRHIVLLMGTESPEGQTRLRC